MIEHRILAVSAALLLGWGGAVAQEPKERPHAQKSQQTQAELEREAVEMLGAVVRLRMTAILNARSNTTLAPSSEGSRVVIDDLRHVVASGYFMQRDDSVNYPIRDDM